MARYQTTFHVSVANLLLAFVTAGGAGAATLAEDADTVCKGLVGGTDAVKVDSTAFLGPSQLVVAERGPTPSGRITPANPAFCKVLGHIDPTDPKAPPIRFQVNLPVEWNGRSLQYGGGGFNGVLITGLALPSAAPFDKPSPLARGFVTYGTDSGHETKPGEPPQVFALNDEAFENFAHRSYKKVRDAAVGLMERAYGKKPEKMYFMGSSEGGREGLTMAQRYPDDFDGIFSRVPVINWVGLLHASMSAGLVTMGEGWIRPAQVKLVADAVRATCDKADGSEDALVQDPVGCKAAFKVEKLRCASGESGDQCLSDAQVNSIQTVQGAYKFPFPLANGLDDYPGWGVSGEDTPPFGPTGGWSAWWLGKAAPAQPPAPENGISWVYGAGATQYVFARDPKLDVTAYKPEDHKARLLEVSNLMDSTNPDLSRFRERKGKLIVLEYMADYAQSPYAGIRYFENVERLMGTATVAQFARLYTAPGVDHVGSGAPANVDMLSVLVDWVEKDQAPGDLEVTEQKVEAPAFPVARSLPLCRWPAWPHFKSGPVTDAASYFCAP
ncbi:tannase/feruloyl esterase family alpha/beta hydrolase [Bradyrhizobium manausense]|uniref:tannase/feruloyl esterase family alpha/beta hydrolase n=1 Tax=Bradyrhizobium TaxID=374 RepID=UPI001BA94E72|nr:MULTISPECIES: tannase/feruloyl esterase family alpha/beta hydrolase [Bradyrhizobium]MBR0829239.1 tannase/feruloyl esterase family alpha/beta hydrolase [Bradyrhizobium manausense]UVO29831.1 tannase/feruloyl esterase family alpha/beta hydrolase [Bradyrhizobium arachidis]